MPPQKALTPREPLNEQLSITTNNNTMYRLLILLGLLAAAAPQSLAQRLPSRKQTLAAMNRANDHFIRKHPDPTKPTFVKKERPSNLWTRGVYFEGLMELVKIDPQQKNIDYIASWGEFHKWTPRNGVTTRDADDYCCCQTYIDFFLWEQPGRPDNGNGAGDRSERHRLGPTMACMQNLMHPVPQEQSPKSKAVFGDNPIHDWTWVDAIQMGLPVLTSLGNLEHARRPDLADEYCEQGWRMYCWTRDTLAGGLFNKEDGLWWRDKDFVPPYKEPNGRHCYWSRGNGWVYAALVRAMDDAPWNTHYADYKADFIQMSEALLKCQRKDRFWNVSLYDEGHFGGKELTGTALFVYGMAWGVRNGILDKATYLPVVSDTWKALVKHCLHKDGALGYVQGTGKEPKDSQPVGYDIEPDFDDFGLGCFLLAGSEIYQLSR